MVLELRGGGGGCQAPGRRRKVNPVVWDQPDGANERCCQETAFPPADRASNEPRREIFCTKTGRGAFWTETTEWVTLEFSEASRAEEGNIIYWDRDSLSFFHLGCASYPSLLRNLG